jgi:hypothetical protein
MIAFLMAAALPASSLAQSQSRGGSGVPSIAIRKTTEVIVIETPRQGVTLYQIMAVIPEKIRANHQYIPVGPSMPLRALNPGAFQ